MERKSLNEIKQEERLRLIGDDIIKGKSRATIYKEYMEYFNCSRQTVKMLYEEAVVRLNEEAETSREHLRTINLSRLEDIYENSKNSTEKLKALDLINKTIGIYETTLNIGNKDEQLKFDIGVKIDDNKE